MKCILCYVTIVTMLRVSLGDGTKGGTVHIVHRVVPGSDRRGVAELMTIFKLSEVSESQTQVADYFCKLLCMYLLLIYID